MKNFSIKYDKNMKENTFKKNILFSFVSQLICYLSPLLTAPYVSRLLGAEGVGSYSFAYSCVYYFSVVVSFGFSAYGVSAIARNKNNKKEYSSCFWNIFFIRTIIMIIALSLYVSVFSFTNCFGGRVAYGVGISLILVLISNALDIKYLYQGLGNFGIVSFAHVVANIIYLIFIFSFVKSETDLLLYTIIKSSIDIIVDIVLFAPLFKAVYFSPTSLTKMASIWLGSLFFFLPSILMSIGGQIDQTLIGFLANQTEVGYYQQALKFPTLLSNLTYCIAPVMLSSISALVTENNVDEIKEKLSKAINFAIFLSAPGVAGLFCVAYDFFPIYFGEEFISSVKIAFFIIPSALMSPINSILINSIYYPMKKNKQMIAILVLTLFENVVLTYVFLKTTNLGARGAAIATLISEFTLFILLAWGARDYLDIKPISKDLLKIGGGFCGIFLSVIPYTVLSGNDGLIKLLIEILLGVFSYLIVELALKESFLTDFFKKTFNSKKKTM